MWPRTTRQLVRGKLILANYWAEKAFGSDPGASAGGWGGMASPTAVIVPLQAKAADMALRRPAQRQPIVGGMPGVVGSHDPGDTVAAVFANNRS